MEDKILLMNEELEKVAGGKAKLDANVQIAFRTAEVQLEKITYDQADANYRKNVNLMCNYCRHALDGSISAESWLAEEVPAHGNKVWWHKTYIIF